MTITPDQADRMKRNAHPGPWDSYSVPDFPGEPGYVAVSIGNREIIIPPRGSGSGTALDAHLIAAAPDLARTVIDQAEEIEKLQDLAGRFEDFLERFYKDFAKALGREDLLGAAEDGSEDDGETIYQLARDTLYEARAAREADQ